MFGYVCDETPDLMPMPIWLAIGWRPGSPRCAGQARSISCGRRQDPGDHRVRGRHPESPRTVISTQHRPGVNIEGDIRPALIEHVIRPCLPQQFADDDFMIYVNPTGAFVLGGPTPTAASPAARSLSTPTAAWPVMAAARSAARTPPRSTGPPRTPFARSPRRSSRPASRSAARRRWPTPSAWPGRCRSSSTRSARARSRPKRWRRSSASTSTCGPRRSSSVSTCGARSSSAPPRTATSGVPTTRAASRGRTWSPARRPPQGR